MFSLRAVTKRYGEAVALDAIDLEFQHGQTTALLGPSGCGKSTILRLLAGLIEPDSGEIYFGTQQVTCARLPGIRQLIGYVIQEGGLFPHLTAWRNVSLVATYLGWERSRIAARVSELSELVQLGTRHLDRYPGELSGGERQRVALMRALMLDPDVLLLDEPLGALDPIIRAEVQAELLEIFRKLRKTVILVTHDLAEAAYLADFVVLLNQGRISQQGTPGDLVERPQNEFVKRFVSAQRGLLEVLQGPT